MHPTKRQILDYLKRHGRAEDVSSAVLFLLQSDFITGQVIYVDGGQHLQGSV